jgi:protein SCO1/2
MSSTIARTARSITARTARSLLTPAPSTSAPFERGAALANRLQRHGRNVLDHQRRFASSSPRARVDANKGPVGWTSLALVSLTGATCLYFYDRERQRRVDGVRAAKTQSNGFQTNVAGGKASVGGAFRLTDSRTGKAFTDKDLFGKWAMLYFGFTHCPDICPDELEKVAEVTTSINSTLEKKHDGTAARLVPVFISIDPSRDTAKRVKEYVKEFHADMIGLTGSEKQCEDAARKYRVYYRKTGDEAAKDDYLVDHSIITYLLNPEGEFVTFYGKNTTEKEVIASVRGHIEAYENQ